MIIKDLREWLETLPAEFDENIMVFRTIDELDEEHYYALDVPIISCTIDEENQEACFMDEKSTIKMEEDE